MPVKTGIQFWIPDFSGMTISIPLHLACPE